MGRSLASPETAVIMATGVQDVASAVTSLQQGAIDYLTKPFGRDRLRDSVMRGVEWHRSARESRRWREALEAELNARRDRIVDAIASLSIDGEAALDRMLSTLTLGDPSAYEHAYRVSALALSIALTMGVPDTDLPALEQAALLHDVGKLAIPDAVLRKPAPLTAEEQLLVFVRPDLGSRVVDLRPVLPLRSSGAPPCERPFCRPTTVPIAPTRINSSDSGSGCHGACGRSRRERCVAAPRSRARVRVRGRCLAVEDRCFAAPASARSLPAPAASPRLPGWASCDEPRSSTAAADGRRLRERPRRPLFRVDTTLEARRSRALDRGSPLPSIVPPMLGFDGRGARSRCTCRHTR